MTKELDRGTDREKSSRYVDREVTCHIGVRHAEQILHAHRGRIEVHHR